MPSAPNTSPLDLNYLHELAAQPDGKLDAAFLRQFLATVLNSALSYRAELSAAVADGGAPRLAFLAHKIAGTARNVGAKDLLRLATRLETLAKTASERGSWQALGAEMQTELEAVLAALAQAASTAPGH